MSLQLQSASFETVPETVHVTKTDSGDALSVLFDRLTIESGPQDTDPRPNAFRLDGSIECHGDGWVHVDLRGYALSTDPHGYAHIAAWVNGRRMIAAPAGADEPVSAGLSAPVRSGTLRISLLLLAQRDLASASSTAACGVDSLDLRVVAPRQRRQA